ncbi:hypothetical protein OIU85_029690, partial [Salix viminalis]
MNVLLIKSSGAVGLILANSSKCRFLWWTFFIALISPCTQAHHVHAISIGHGHETEF